MSTSDVVFIGKYRVVLYLYEFELNCLHTDQ